MAGCCHGSPWDGPWAVTFTDPRSVAPLGAPLHPTQLYEAGFLFALGTALNVLYGKKRYHGQIMLIYLVGYALGRTVVEEFRGDASRGWFWPELLGQSLTYSQGISIVIAVVSGTSAFMSVNDSNSAPSASKSAPSTAIGVSRDSGAPMITSGDSA